MERLTRKNAQGEIVWFDYAQELNDPEAIGRTARSAICLLEDYGLAVDECREAVAKSRAVMATVIDDGDAVVCPSCNQSVPGYYADYCEHCGQHIDRPDGFYE